MVLDVDVSRPNTAPIKARRRKFGDPAWAWPPNSRDSLLKAALLPDTAAARAALVHWLAHHDLDEIGFADHRLLAAISERHGAAIRDLPEYPRLKGLQRQLWTQSRIRLHAVLPALRALGSSGVEIMLLKGAARIALNPAAQRQRAQQDLDILVREEQMAKAAQVLTAGGWQTVRGDTALSAVARAPAARAINFQLHPWGDVDLHRCAYHGGNHHAQLDARIWLDAEPAQFFDLPVLVPCAEERLAMTLSHGAWSPESHSDWLIDAADIIASNKVDWGRACEIFTRRRMVLQARIGLSYLQSELQINPPAEAQDLLGALRPERGIQGIGTLLIARAEQDLTGWQRSLRKIWFSYSRSRRKGGAMPVPPLAVALARKVRGAIAADMPRSKIAVLDRGFVAPDTGGGEIDFVANVVFEAPGTLRRIEFELNSEVQNLARFRVFALRRSKGLLRARLCARIRLTPGCGALRLEARPGKFLIPGLDASELKKYAAIPFYLVGSSLEASR